MLTIHWAHDHSTILVHNTDLQTISIPAHAPHHRFIPVINHFFIPGTGLTHKNHKKVSHSCTSTVHNQVWVLYSLNITVFSIWCVKGLCTFVKHPDNNEPILVTGGQFLMLFIPSHNLHCTCIAKWKLWELVHTNTKTKHRQWAEICPLSFLPLCPSSVWFIERLLGAAKPFSLASSKKKLCT